MGAHLQPECASVLANRPEGLYGALLRTWGDGGDDLASVSMSLDVALVFVKDVDAEGSCFGDVLDLPDLVPYGGEGVGLDGRSVVMVRCNVGATNTISSSR